MKGRGRKGEEEVVRERRRGGRSGPRRLCTWPCRRGSSVRSATSTNCSSRRWRCGGGSDTTRTSGAPTSGGRAGLVGAGYRRNRRRHRGGHWRAGGWGSRRRAVRRWGHGLHTGAEVPGHRGAGVWAEVAGPRSGWFREPLGAQGSGWRGAPGCCRAGGDRCRWTPGCPGAPTSTSSTRTTAPTEVGPPGRTSGGE